MSEAVPQEENSLEIKRQEYQDFLTDFGLLISLNAVHLDKYALPGHEEEIREMLRGFRGAFINGKSFNDFTFENDPAVLRRPDVARALLEQIRLHLVYMEPRISFLDPESGFVKRYSAVRERYTALVNPSGP